MPKLLAALMTILTLALASPRAHAQPLIEQVPDTAVFYLGWQGATQIGGSYTQSHTHALLQEPQVQQFVSQSIQAFQTLNEDDQSKETEILRKLLAVAPSVWNHPVAAYVTGLDSPRNQSPQLVVMIQPPADQKTLLIDALRSNPALRDAQAVITENAGRVVLQFAPPGMKPAKLATPAKNLASQDRYAHAIGQLSDKAALVGYLDVATLINLAQQQAKQQMQSEDGPDPAKLIESAGLLGVNAIALTSQFEDKHLVSRLFVDAPSPRKGFLALLDDQKLTRDDLAIIPASATGIYAYKLDPAKLLETVRAYVSQAMPDQAGAVDQVLMQGSMMTGVNLQEDFIKAMGPTWILYSGPSLGSTMMGANFGLVGQLNDAAKMKQSLRQFKAAILSQVAAMQENGDTPFSIPVTFQTIQYEGLEIHTCYVSILAASCTIVDDKLFVSLSPRGLVGMVQAARDTRDNITTLPAFQDTLARFGGLEGVSMLQYVNLPALAPDGYQLLMFINQMVAMGLSTQEKADPRGLPRLPALDVLLRHTHPSAGAFVTDDRGFHLRYTTPFPGAEALGMQFNATAMMPMMAGAMLPALGAARRTARQMQSVTQARGIGAGCVLFLQGSPNTPPDIAQLVHDNYFTIEYAISPSSRKAVPHDFDTWEKDRQTQWIRANASYILVTKGMKDTSDPEQIFVFERPEDSGNPDMIAVCYADNHAAWEPVAQIKETLLKQTGLTMEQLIQMQEQGKR